MRRADRREPHGTVGGSDRVARVEVEHRLRQLPVAEGNGPTGLADDQLGGGGVDRAAGPQAQHRVEAAGGDVGGGDRDRTDNPQAEDLAGEGLEGRQRPLGLDRLDADDLEPLGLGRDPHGTPVQLRAGAAAGEELLVGAEVMDEAELDVGHRGAGGDRDRDREGGDRAAGVERAVDRVDHHPLPTAGAEGDFAALLGDGDEGGALGGQPLELGEDDVLAAAVDDQGAIASLADALIDGALLAGQGLGEDRALGGDDAAADRRPVGGEEIHRRDARGTLDKR